MDPSFQQLMVQQLMSQGSLPADMKYQFQKMNNDATVPRSELQEAQATAVLFSNYIETLKAGVEQMTLEQAH